MSSHTISRAAATAVAALMLATGFVAGAVFSNHHSGTTPPAPITPTGPSHPTTMSMPARITVTSGAQSGS